MYRGVFLLVACLATTACGNVIVPKVPMPDGRIVGGEETTIERFPYQVSVRLLGSHSCGGSIINEKTVLTAAHCIFPINAQYYSIAYGATSVNGGKTVVAERLLKHPKYNSQTIDYDIALIFLKSPIELGPNAKTISLASVAPAPGTPAVVSGWGNLAETGGAPDKLQKVEVNTVAKQACSDAYNGLNDITDRMLCAGVPEGGKDACQGDSGGPLAANNQLVGIVSWGLGCARPGVPGVYTNVANLKHWVDENVN